MPHVKYDGLSKRQRKLAEQTLQDLYRNKVGKQLINQIEEKLGEIGKFVHIKAGKNHAVKEPKNETDPLILTLNFQSIDFRYIDSGKERFWFTRAPCLGAQAGKKSKAFPIGSSEVPFYIVLGHELIHIKHFLEDEKTYKEYSARFDNTLWPIPSVGDKQRAEWIWHDLEEQRTVIGTPDSGEICEWTLRLAAGIAPRYAYQGAEDYFLEDE